MKKCELLSPAGDFDCLKAAVQNGADSVYLGASTFSARAFANNFNIDELKKAIEYAKLRNVGVHLALNTLIKNNELDDALMLANISYNYGVDAIIVQDLGLAKLLIDAFPNLPIHASTQMTIHNLESVIQLEKLGFSRAVLSRELSLDEIKYITQNSNIETEVFVHGALCISYSGQCLLSSAIGGRSGNRGKCAGPCRLPYELVDSKNNVLNTGYLLNTKDLCSLEYLPKLIDANVTSFKIEGRMKTPEYVATITRIYRKYIDMIYENKDYIISQEDVEDLLQVFNRGNFSSGHLDNKPNKNLIYKNSPTNLGIFLGNVINFNQNKGYIKLKLNNSLSIGDKVSINNNTYNVSELMINNKNLKTAEKNDIITIGRMKGNIKINDNIYRIQNHLLTDNAIKSFTNIENKKIKLNSKLIIKHNQPIQIFINPIDDKFYKDINIELSSDIIPEKSINNPISKERIISQIKKTGNTEFEFVNIDVDMDDNLYIPSISKLNDLRRNSLALLEQKVIQKYQNNHDTPSYVIEKNISDTNKEKTISILLNIINNSFDYKKLTNIDNIYIPLKFFTTSLYKNKIKELCDNYNVYIYLPTIIKKNYKNIIDNNMEKLIESYKIKGFVISHLSQIEMIKNYNLELIGNYTLNVFNDLTIAEYKKLGLTIITHSPELDNAFVNNFQNIFSSEVIVYGNLPVMTMNYCPLSNSNKCIENCKRYCMNNEKYYLKDRLKFNFRIIPDNIETVTTMYNSKMTSVLQSNYNCSRFRLDFIDESIEDINNITNLFLSNRRPEGQIYTNGINLQ